MKDNIDELLSQYFRSPWELHEVPFGLINSTRIVMSNSKRYVLRISDPHFKDSNKMQYEYEIIHCLNQKELPFMIPSFEPTLTGHPYLMMSNGTFGRVSHYIHGSVPTVKNPRHVIAIGKASGLLIDALSKVEMAVPATSVPFYDFYHLHPLVSRSVLESFIKSPPFLCERVELDV